MQEISFGGAKHERVAIEVRSYERAATGQFDDDNWLTVSIAVAAGAFRGRVDAAFQVAELVAFRNDLAALYKTLKGRAALRTMEEQLSLDFEGTGLGSVEMRGEILDQPGIGNRDRTEVRLVEVFQLCGRGDSARRHSGADRALEPASARGGFRFAGGGSDL